MFGKKESLSEMTKVENLIAADTKFIGAVLTKKSLRIDGDLEGEIKEADGVILGKGGFIKGNINARSVIISGKVVGNISCLGRIEILKGGELQGDIRATELVINEGVVFNGKCEMTRNSSGLRQKPSAHLGGQAPPPEKEH